MNRQSQHEMIIEALQQGRSLTVATALTELGIYALSQRIGELKKKGYDIQSQTIVHNGKHFKRYWLAP